MRSRAALANAMCRTCVVSVVIAVGCNPLPASEPAGERIVVAQVPAGAGVSMTRERLRPNARYPLGSRIVVASPDRGPGDVRALSGDLVAAGAPDVSPDSDSLLFAGRRTPESSWAVFEAGISGRRAPRVVVERDGDCIDPAYLGAGRIVVVCRESAGPPARGTGSWSLFTAQRDGSELERITFGPGPAFDPTPLQDGRILFSMWQAAGRGRPGQGAVALFTANPDGTLIEPFAGSHEPPELKVRARETGDGRVVFVADGADGRPPSLRQVEMRRPRATGAALELRAREAAIHLLDLGGVEPLADGGFLVAGRAAGPDGGPPQTWAVFRAGPSGTEMEGAFDDPGWDDVEAVPVESRAAPRGRPVFRERDRSTGAVVCYDARRSDGSVGPAGDRHPVSVSVQAAGVVAVAAASGSGSGSGTPPAPNASGPASGTELGLVPIEGDGSFFIEVPADRPIRVETRDAGGAVIAASEWFWVRPGEVRSCFGCHESRDAAPVNRVVAAIANPPVPLGSLAQAARR